MTIYTITTLFRSEDNTDVHTYVKHTKEEAIDLAKKLREDFHKEYFESGDNDYCEGVESDWYIEAWSNAWFLNFSADITEHEI